MSGRRPRSPRHGLSALAGAALALSGLCQGVDAQDPRDVIRMGAFQCLVCPDGGFLEGVRDGDHGRVKEVFGAFKSLCIASYEYIDGELYLRFLLDNRPWPRDGVIGLKANSWNAECTGSSGGL